MNLRYSLTLLATVIMLSIGGLAFLTSPNDTIKVLPTLATFPTTDMQFIEDIIPETQLNFSGYEQPFQSEKIITHINKQSEVAETPSTIIEIPTNAPSSLEDTNIIEAIITNPEHSVSQNVISSEIITDLRQTGNKPQVPVMSENSPVATESSLNLTNVETNNASFASANVSSTAAPNSAALIHPQVQADIIQNGSADVLISLNLSNKTASNKRPDLNEIAQAQKQVIDSQGKNDFQLKSTLSHAPVIYAHINQNALNGLKNNPNIASISPNFTGEFSLDDGRIAIGAEVAMANYGFTGDGVTVAILDTGIDTDHPDLVDSIIAQRCYTISSCGGGSSQSNNAEDDAGHGTHVAGIVTSAAGFAPNADIVVIRIGSTNQSPELRLFDVLLGLDWLIIQLDAGTFEVDVINMSFSFTADNAICDSLAGYTDLFDLLDILETEHNIISFAASGNNGFLTEIRLPACYSNVIAVGATFDSGTVPSNELSTCTDRPYTIDSITCYSNTSDWLDIVTVGSGVLSTYLDGGYATSSGTSMASPAAAGIAALMREADPTLTRSEIRQIMRDTGFPAYNPSNGVTVPAIDAWNAIYASAANTPTADCNPNQQIRLVSKPMYDTSGDANSSMPSIAANGRYVTFTSSSTNLIATDTNAFNDAFVYDLQTCRIQRISTNTSGFEGTNHSEISNRDAISPDGTYITFASLAPNLDPNDVVNSGQNDIFVHDRTWAYTNLISFAYDEIQANDGGWASVIGTDDSFIAFESNSTNLVSSDTNSKTDVFVRDQASNDTYLISVATGGTQGNDDSILASMTPDGRYIVFSSLANNLVASDTNSANDVFVHDRDTGITERVSVSSLGDEGNGSSSGAAITDDGHYVLFSSSATNLVVDDTNSVTDLFLHDRTTGDTIRVSYTDSGQELQQGVTDTRIAMSDDTRYIAFVSNDSTIVPDDTNSSSDVFVRDRVTGRTVRASVTALGEEKIEILISFELDMSSDGQYLVFDTAMQLVPTDSVDTKDIFLVDTTYFFPPPFIYTAANLTATAISASQVDLDWDDIPSDESGYIIERSTDGSSWSSIATIAANSTSYQDNTAVCNLYVTYQYRIQAYRSNADASTTFSAYSDTASANNLACNEPVAIVLTAPTDTANFPRSTALVFSWNADANASEYYVEYWGGPSADVISSGWISSTSWNVGTVKGGVYHWRVKGRNAFVESPWSSLWEFTATLAEPTNLQATPATSSIALTWTASSDAPSNIAAYNLYHDATLLTSLATNATSYTHNGLLCDDAQAYYLTAYELPSFESAATTTLNTNTSACPIPETATNLTIQYNSGNISLNWQLNYDEASTTFIERAIDGGGWTQIDSVSSDIKTYVDVSSPCETVLAYRLYARRDRVGPDSAYSNEVSQLMPPCTPHTLATNSSDKTKINLSWIDASSSETQFYIDVSSSGTSGWQQNSALPANSSNYTLTGLSCGTTRYFRIRAYRATDKLNSDYSEIVSGTSQSCPALSAPSSPSSTSNTSADINLVVESATTSDIQNIRVQRSTDDATWGEVAILPASGGLWIDSTVECGATYYYRTVNYRPEDSTFSPPSSSVMVSTDACLPIIASRVGLYSNSIWQFSNSLAGGSASSQLSFGAAKDGWKPITGDWNGDGIDGIGLYKDGVFMLRDGSEWSFNFGQLESGWQPIAGDWNGDGTDGIGLYKGGIFMLRNTASSGSADYQFSFGDNTYAWQALAGDWSGNGSDTVALYYNGQWQLSHQNSSNSSATSLNFGANEGGWMPVVGDWDANGIDSLGLYQNGIWKIRNTNSSGAPDYNFSFGAAQAGCLPVSIAVNSLP